jgi:hypothetical protein
MKLQVGVPIRGMLASALKSSNRMAKEAVCIFGLRISQGELPCHSQVNDLSMAIQFKDKVFRPSLQVTDSLAGESFTQ